jgi:hypothetical protein
MKTFIQFFLGITFLFPLCTNLSFGQNQNPLPQGVTQDWLNDLRDENGNNIDIGQAAVPNIDDEGDALQRKIFTGLVSGANYGSSISSAGDVNGDGFDDIIVGAQAYSSSTGRAYIYYGGNPMNTIPDVVMTGEATNSSFGISVSSAGDLNGDGYSDVIVGASQYNFYRGRAYVYFGGPVMNNTVDIVLTGESITDQFGYSVSAAGDVNGDGYADIIVGAYGRSSFLGKAYIFFGGLSMDDFPDVSFNGEISGSSFGVSVSTAGDVNADGFSDVIIGASGIASSSGRAYIFFGGTVMDDVVDVFMNGEAVSNSFGESVSDAGDVNGDGYSDVIVGAQYNSSSTGKAYIFFGSSYMDDLPDVTMSGESTSSLFGCSVSTAGDVNGDGYSDVIIGARGAASLGKVYTYFGGAAMNGAADFVMTGEAGGSFGTCVSSAGDVNGDGYSDVIAGAPIFASSTGRVYLFDYFMKNEIIGDFTFNGEAASSNHGRSVSSAGDVNGDGYEDIIVGAPLYSPGGRAFIYYGGEPMNSAADVVMTGDASTTFGISVSSAGDVNADGYSDVIVGANNYFTATGRAYIYFGGSTMNNVADVIMTGEGTNTQFGISVSEAGDVNGDGYSDVIVGASVYNSSMGRAYIFFGGDVMNNVADVIMTGEFTTNQFGRSVSGAHDLNGDGYSDVVVGASGYSTATGRAYVYYGGSPMNNVADVIMTGEAATNSFGIAVSNAGDVNRDGYNDVIIGAPGFSASTGKAYIFFGGASMNNVADVTMIGEAAANNFGTSVASARDMNQDRYADVIVGADGYNSSAGRAYVFYGADAMDAVPDITMTGEATNHFLGYSVSSAGDVNGDGYPDLIAGASGFNSNLGRTYVYLGSAISAKPILIHVKDVPNDQGGKVHLKWARSSFDVNGNNMLTGYSVYRSYPPSGGNFSWEQITSVTPAHHSFYSYTDLTPYDSSSNHNGNLFYKIRAKTSNPNQFWESAILSGRSIDNIAPVLVSPFTATGVLSNVLLSWKRSAAPDLMNYILYRSFSPSINPETEPVFATTTDSTFLDISPLSGIYYYFIVAQDIHNNKSPVAVAQAPLMQLSVTMFIEGFYSNTSDTQVSDTIIAELRNAVSPFGAVDSKADVVLANGMATFSFINASPGNYYIVLKHRNSIDTWSAVASAFSYSTPVTYDFSIAASQSFGSNMKQVDGSPVRHAIYGGDVNKDDIVDLSDVINIFNDAVVFVSGYVVTDVTGDEFVDLSDVTLTYNNATAFVAAVTP